jgi:hypothetical protein
MARISRTAIMAAYDASYADAVAQITRKLDTLTDAQKTISTAFGAATVVAFRWQPASIGGTWGTYRMESGSTSGFVAGNELYRIAEMVGVTLPKYPR